MSSAANNSSSTINRLDTMFLRHQIGRLQAYDSDNHVTDNDFIFDEEGELKYQYEDDKPSPYQDDGLRAIYQEEVRIEAEVIYRILNGKAHTLKPNSGETVMIRENSIVVGFHVDEEEGEYIAWEWHGHIPRYTEEHQYSLEHIYGNYFRRIMPEERPPTPSPVDAAADKGLKDLSDGDVNPASGRIFHRNLNIGSAASSKSPFTKPCGCCVNGSILLDEDWSPSILNFPNPF